jgi:hypothetical protein
MPGRRLYFHITYHRRISSYQYTVTTFFLLPLEFNNIKLQGIKFYGLDFFSFS